MTVEFNTGFVAEGPLTVGFETRAENLQFGVSVQGARCGVIGESLKKSGERGPIVDGVGVQGVGEVYGVIGESNIGIAGVLGENSNVRKGSSNGIGVIGAVMRGGTGVVGASFESLSRPLSQFQEVPDSANGSGTGVLGASGTGVGVQGHSKDNDGVVGRSGANNKSGVFGFNSQQSGVAFGVFGGCDAPDGAGVGGESGFGAGVRGHSTANDGVVGISDANGKSGVFGFSAGGHGVFGSSKSSRGVGGISETDIGVAGFSTSGHGAFGQTGVVGQEDHFGNSGVFGVHLGKHTTTIILGHIPPAPSGVTGKADAGVGVFGTSDNGTGISGKGGTYGGILEGTRAPLRLVPSLADGPPTIGRHEMGEFVVDSSGSLFFCIAPGNPGTWMRVQLVAP